MRPKLAAVCVVVVALFAGTRVPFGYAKDKEADSSPADPIAAEYERLGRKYQQLVAAREEVFPRPLDTNLPSATSLSDEQWLKERLTKQTSAPNPNSLLPQFVSFAQDNPSSPLAFDAIFFIILKTGFKEFRSDGKPWPLREQTLELAWTDHKDDPRMVHLLALLKVPSFQSESFLKRALEDTPNRTVRAAANYHLAKYYRLLAACHKRSQRVQNKPSLTNDERFWKLVVTAKLNRHLPLNAEENSERIENLLGLVIAEYSDLAATNWRLAGANRNHLVTTALCGSPKTYGDLAAALLHELTNLASGMPMPEIVGTDADGKPFRLSDYRGQVVLLTFSANWCPGCVKFYPMARRLQEKYRNRPFVVLGVNRNKSIDTLKSAIAEGKITWRCWWDGGKDGPISNALNAAAGSLFLLDGQHVIQDSGLSVISFEEDFKQAIEPLLKKAAARTRTAQ